MRFIRLLVLLTLLGLPLVLVSSAGALDICEEECQPPDAEQNTPYEFQFVGEEGCEQSYTFTHQNGAMPPGLTLSSKGLLSGTPTEAGDFEFWVALDDFPGCPGVSPQSQGHFFMTVMPDLAVTTTSLPRATPGQPYSVQLEFSNPEQGWPVIWDITQGGLPSGLTLSESGVISGTPSGPDTKTFRVRAREPFRRFGERDLTLTVATALRTSSALGPGEVRLRYAGAVRGTGGVAPLTYAIASGSLPAGLALNPTTGAVAGVPRAAGRFAVTFAVRDAANQEVSVPASIRIVTRLAVESSRVPAATVGAAYRAQLATGGGLAPVTWRVTRGGLPRGIRLDRRTGTLSGTPRAAGTFRFIVEARDRLGARSTRTLRLRVTR